MISDSEYLSILQRVRECYLSLDNPSFHFKRKAYAKKIYRHVELLLRGVFEVEDDTDINIDVSFQYVLYSTNLIWSVQLSMVGSYAAIWRVVKPGEILQVIDPSTLDLLEDEQKLMQILTQQDIKILDKSSLSIGIPLKLPYMETDKVRIYQALFTELDTLPWE